MSVRIILNCSIMTENRRSMKIRRDLLQLLLALAPQGNARMASTFMREKDRRTMIQDVRRSVSFWDIHTHLKMKFRLRKRKNLMKCLENTFSTSSTVKYYQGLHDICLFILELCDENVDLARDITVGLFTAHFHDFMNTDFNRSLVPRLESIEELISRADPELADRISRAGVGYFFAVPWILTWFTHSVRSFDKLCVILRSVLSPCSISSQERVVYICVSALILNRDRILCETNDTGSVFREAQLSPDLVSVNSLVQKSLFLMSSFPMKIPTIHATSIRIGCRTVWIVLVSSILLNAFAFLLSSTENAQLLSGWS